MKKKTFQLALIVGVVGLIMGGAWWNFESSTLDEKKWIAEAKEVVLKINQNQVIPEIKVISILEFPNPSPDTLYVQFSKNRTNTIFDNGVIKFNKYIFDFSDTGKGLSLLLAINYHQTNFVDISKEAREIIAIQNTVYFLNRKLVNYTYKILEGEKNVSGTFKSSKECEQHQVINLMFYSMAFSNCADWQCKIKALNEVKFSDKKITRKDY